MSFRMPDLIIESILRDGFENARRDPSVIDDVFCDLTRSYASKKYGNKEIEKIKKIIEEDEVSIIHSFNLSQVTMPCISIQLADDRESQERAHMGNLRGMTMASLDEDETADLVKVEAFTPTSYDPITGIVKVDDSVNLAPAYANLLFVDVEGTEHLIIGGIVNDTGLKQFIVEPNSEVAITGPGEIKSSLNYKLYQKRGNIEQTQIILGISSRDALMTKYFYILVKYFMLSRRDDLIARGIDISTYTGSDFTRNMEYGADVVYTRFFNIAGTVEHEWRSDKVQLIDSVDVQVLVPKDEAGNEALKLEDMTIQVRE